MLFSKNINNNYPAVPAALPQKDFAKYEGSKNQSPNTNKQFKFGSIDYFYCISRKRNKKYIISLCYIYFIIFQHSPQQKLIMVTI